MHVLNTLKVGHLIISKIIKYVATRCQILRLKCTKFNFGWGSTPDPAGGAYTAPPKPLAGFKEPTSKGGNEKRWGIGNAAVASCKVGGDKTHGNRRWEQHAANEQMVRERVEDCRRRHGYIVRGSHLSPCHSLLCTHDAYVFQ